MKYLVKVTRRFNGKASPISYENGNTELYWHINAGSANHARDRVRQDFKEQFAHNSEILTMETEQKK